MPHNMLTELDRTNTEEQLKELSDYPTTGTDGVPRRGIQTRVTHLLSSLGELNANNSVALWTRYYWESQIQKILNDEPYHPATLEIDLTTFCDSGCFFCKEGLEKKAITYPYEKLEQDLLSYKDIPETSMVIFSGGGEPTASKYFAKAMEIAHLLGYQIYVSTHGGRIGTRSLPHDVFTNNATILKVSIGAASHKVYNEIHNSGKEVQERALYSVDYIFDQIKVISETRRSVTSLGVTVKLPRIFAAMTVSPLNQREVIMMTEKAIAAGVDTLLFRPLITTDTNLLRIDQGIDQMRYVKEHYKDQIEILTFNHRLDYGFKTEDHFTECFSHPVVSPGGPDGQGSITPCVFRRGNRPDNYWLSAGDPKTQDLKTLVESPEYLTSVQTQNEHLHSDCSKRCPRCRKVPNNIYMDILKQASETEREKIREIILDLYPQNPTGELIHGLH